MVRTQHYTHPLVFGSQLLLCQVQVHRKLLIIGELAQDVGVVCLPLSDGGVQADHHQCLGRVGLGQHKQAHDAVILDPVVLRLQVGNMQDVAVVSPQRQTCSGWVQRPVPADWACQWGMLVLANTKRRTLHLVCAVLHLHGGNKQFVADVPAASSCSFPGECVTLGAAKACLHIEHEHLCGQSAHGTVAPSTVNWVQQSRACSLWHVQR